MDEKITFDAVGGRVLIGMSENDYAELLVILGMICGSSTRRGNPEMFYRTLRFVNRLNADNPRYQPYAIPEEYR